MNKNEINAIKTRIKGLEKSVRELKKDTEMLLENDCLNYNNKTKNKREFEEYAERICLWAMKNS